MFALMASAMSCDPHDKTTRVRVIMVQGMEVGSDGVASPIEFSSTSIYVIAPDGKTVLSAEEISSGQNYGPQETTTLIVEESLAEFEFITVKVDGYAETDVPVTSGRNTKRLIADELTEVIVNLGPPVIIGDGKVVRPVEECDDTNTVAGDGCSAEGIQEAGWICGSGEEAQCDPEYGDGRIVGEEDCDTGTNNPEAGCSEGVILDGFVCEDGEPSVCTATCGNGVEDANEECDDGNIAINDGCSNNCLVESDYICEGWPSDCRTCGNGLVETGEYCDDGNTDDQDGCSSACVIEAHYRCDLTDSGASDCTTPCGDGIRVPAEECDDRNGILGDGCSDCRIDPGYTCVPNPDSGGPEGSVCTTQCGDGLIVGAVEGCDDGNQTPGDGCSPSCFPELGFSCDSEGCSPICGDMLEVGDEPCDDGNFDPTDGCLPNCTEEGVCGNGFKELGIENTPDEGCDDGNTEGGDGCSENCVVEADYACFGNQSVCSPCPDGAVNGEEQCDDGNDNAGDGCALCVIESGWRCLTGAGQVSTCTQGCGDGVLEEDFGEECDDGNTTSDDGCSSGCRLETKCGNGTLDTDRGETCDDGNTQIGDGCNISCQVEAGFVCEYPAYFCHGICGDGQIVGDEYCDDANTQDGDGCSGETCVVENGFECRTDVSGEYACVTRCGDDVVAGAETCEPPGTDTCDTQCQLTVAGCGDGIVQSDETCDDGNAVGGDGCDVMCSIEAGYECPNADAPCFTACGDGVIAGQEECDDGNEMAGDGCGENCFEEFGYLCFPAAGGSSCSEQCGDGWIVGSEECDDDNFDNNDGCTDCVVDPGFQCGTTTGGTYACTMTMTAGCPAGYYDDGIGCSGICGDGTVVAGEECDDNNAVDGDGCTACIVDPGFQCVTTVGGAYACTMTTLPGCQTGYYDPGGGCQDIDECLSGLDNCASTDICVNSDGAFTCDPAPTGYCGNGLTETLLVGPVEECDDGNVSNTPEDGCSHDCQETSGWRCEGQPSQCAKLANFFDVATACMGQGEDLGTNTLDVQGCVQDNLDNDAGIDNDTVFYFDSTYKYRIDGLRVSWQGFAVGTGPVFVGDADPVTGAPLTVILDQGNYVEPTSANPSNSSAFYITSDRFRLQGIRLSSIEAGWQNIIAVEDSLSQVEIVGSKIGPSTGIGIVTHSAQSILIDRSVVAENEHMGFRSYANPVSAAICNTSNHSGCARDIEIRNSLFTRNGLKQSTNLGISGEETSGWGAIFLRNWATIENTTIVDNYCSPKQFGRPTPYHHKDCGLSLIFDQGVESNVFVQGAIIAFNEPTSLGDEEFFVYADSYSDSIISYAADISSESPNTFLSNVSDADPLLQSTSPDWFGAGLTPQSPCIDYVSEAASMSLEVDAHLGPRPIGASNDCGWREYRP